NAMTSLSNQVTKALADQALERSESSLALSNRQSLIDFRTHELIAVSNGLLQTSLLLSNTQSELRFTQDNLATKIATALDAHGKELERQAMVIPALQREITELKVQVAQAQLTKTNLEESLNRARIEKTNMQRWFDDPEFLRLQVKRAEEHQRVAKKQRAS